MKKLCFGVFDQLKPLQWLVPGNYACNIAHDKAVCIAAMFIIKPLIAIMIFSKIVAWFAF